jgi:hypothetical protein
VAAAETGGVRALYAAKDTTIMYRQALIYVILFCFMYILLAACGNVAPPPTPTPTPPPTPTPTPTPTPENPITLGELQKSKEGILYGLTYRETITVQNCNNPLPRSDNLTEARTVDRAVAWNIAGEVSGEVEASVIVAGAKIQAAITSGYELY